MIGRSRLRQRRAGGAILVACLLMLSACGDSDGGGGDFGNSGDELEGAPIKIMVVSPVATPIQNYPDVDVAAEAAADDINESGGIDGRPVEIVSCNDKSDPNAAGACARRAVDEGVVAIYAQTLNGATIYPVLAEAKIPAIVTANTEPDWTTENVYPLGNGGTAFGLAAPFAFKEEGLSKVGMIGLDIPTMENHLDLVTLAAPNADVDFVGTVRIPLDATDLAPYVQQLKELGADSAMVGVSATGLLQLLRTAQQSGLDIPVAVPAGIISQEELEQLGELGEGVKLIDSAPSPSYASESTDNLNARLDAAEEQGVDGPQRRGSRTVDAWEAVHVIAAAIKEAGLTGDGITAEALSAAIPDFGEVKVDDLYTWNPNVEGPEIRPRVGNGLQYVGTIEDGKVVWADDPIDSYAENDLQPVG